MCVQAAGVCRCQGGSEPAVQGWPRTNSRARPGWPQRGSGQAECRQAGRQAHPRVLKSSQPQVQDSFGILQPRQADRQAGLHTPTCRYSEPPSAPVARYRPIWIVCPTSTMPGKPAAGNQASRHPGDTGGLGAARCVHGRHERVMGGCCRSMQVAGQLASGAGRTVVGDWED